MATLNHTSSMSDHRLASSWRRVVGAALAGAVYARESLRDRHLGRLARQLVRATLARVRESAGRLGPRTI